MPFTNWKMKLAGEKVISFVSGPTDKDEGYYRIKITEKAENGSGRNILKGYIPVAYYLYDGKMTGNIGDGDGGYRPMNDDEIVAKWTHCCGSAIPYEWYQAVAERGEPWPDMADKLVMADSNGDAVPAVLDADNGGLVPASNRAVRLSDNQPPAPPVVEEEPHVAHAREIDAAIAAAIKAVNSDEDAALAAGSMNRIAELRLKTEKAGKALYDPPFREYKRILGIWKPIVDRASANEAVLDRQIKVYRAGVIKRAKEAAAKEQSRLAEEAAKERARLAEEEAANARAADRAIAAGLPEPAPQVTEPAPPPAPVVIPTVAPVVASYGTRKVKEEMKLFVDKVTDWPALCAHFSGNADVQALLLRLATKDIRAGLMVPGITTREDLI